MHHFSRALCATTALFGSECQDRRVLVSENASETAFANHQAKFGLNYKTKEEHRFRKAIFESHGRQIDQINKEEKDFKLVRNKFATWTDEEIQDMLGKRGGPETENPPEPEESGRLLKGKPTCGTKRTPPCPDDNDGGDGPTDEATVDWRTTGSVSPVKDQGGCGSCWAFGATTAIESAYHIKTGTLYHLSEQQLVDCDTSCYGCSGGWAVNSMNYARRNALVLDSDYSYRGRDQNCQVAGKTGKVKTTNVVTLEVNSVSAMKTALDKGPIAMGIAAGNSYVMYYESGIINTTRCGKNARIDHDLTAIGYGVENGQEYWLIQNQWGTDWGDRGFMKIAAKENHYGICKVQMDNHYAEVMTA